jgi:uncharacterized protein
MTSVADHVKAQLTEHGFLVEAKWDRPLFLHYRVAVAELENHVSREYDIETFDGSAWVTVVAIRMTNFRPQKGAPFYKWFFPCVGAQKFLNVRTYVRHKKTGESGLYFLWGWLSRPRGLPFPKQPLGLPCGSAQINYTTPPPHLNFAVQAEGEQFTFEGVVEDATYFKVPAAGSFEEFALERYNGFFTHGKQEKIFRAWHPPWEGWKVSIRSLRANLLGRRFPWLAGKKPDVVHYSPGFETVSMDGAKNLKGEQPTTAQLKAQTYEK